jgi:hypothetical protein
VRAKPSKDDPSRGERPGTSPEDEASGTAYLQRSRPSTLAEAPMQARTLSWNDLNDGFVVAILIEAKPG